MLERAMLDLLMVQFEQLNRLLEEPYGTPCAMDCIAKSEETILAMQNMSNPPADSK